MSDGRKSVSTKGKAITALNSTIEAEFIILHWLKESPAIFATSFIVLMAMLGAFYDVQFYNLFDINIVKFSRPTDFIFGWARDYFAISIVLGGISVCVGSIIGVFFSSLLYSSKTRTTFVTMIVGLAIGVIPLVVSRMYYGASAYGSITGYAKVGALMTLSIAGMSLSIGTIAKEDFRGHERLLARLFGLFLIVIWTAVVVSDIPKAVESAHGKIIRGEQESYSILVKDDPSIVAEVPYQLVGTTSQYSIFYNPSSKEIRIIPSENLISFKMIKAASSQTQAAESSVTPPQQ